MRATRQKDFREAREKGEATWSGEEKTEGHWRVPDPEVVSLMSEWSPPRGLTAYDLGCGLGRHTLFLFQRGFRVYASDIAMSALRQCSNWLTREGFPSLLTRNDLTTIPYLDESFDFVLAFYTIYHARLGDMQKCLQEIHRTLRANGRVLVNLRTDRDSACGKGVKIEERTFAVPEHGQKDVIHHFCSEGEVGDLFRGFRILKRERGERKREGGDTASHWIVLATKM